MPRRARGGTQVQARGAETAADPIAVTAGVMMLAIVTAMALVVVAIAALGGVQ